MQERVTGGPGHRPPPADDVEHVADLSRALDAATARANDAEARYGRLASRRSVRLALLVSRAAAPLFRVARRIRRPRPSPVDPVDAPPEGPELSRRKAEIDAAAAAIAPASSDGPLVSIVVPTRNGAHHLERLLPALQATVYASFELLVVDNASTDGTAQSISQHRGSLDLRVITNETNLSFSRANNEAVRGHARGALLVFLNDDTEPLNPNWLGHLVDAVRAPGVVAAGAVLVYPERGASSDLTVQHAGVTFGFRDGRPHAFPVRAPSPLPFVGARRRAPAVTAAALVLAREDFDAVGGFDETYVYGTEDVDLCVKLRSLGEIVVAGDALVWHHEHATLSKESGETLSDNQRRNWGHFVERWSPPLSRSIRRSALARAGTWTTDRAPRVAITLTDDDESVGAGDWYTAHELGSALGELGWEVVYAERVEDRWYGLGDDIDAVISLLDSYDVRRAPRGAVTVAWIRNWVDRWQQRPWLWHFDDLAVSSALGADAIGSAVGVRPEVVPIGANVERFHTGDPDPELACDIAFTGNHWGVKRDVLEMLELRDGERFGLFGKKWNEAPDWASHWQGHLRHDRMPALYRSVKVVLDDTAAPTLPHGFLNSRVFDALAAGALVLTDNEAGSAEVFDGLLPVYRDAAELRSLLDRYLSDDEERRRLVGELRGRVLAAHTYELRAVTFDRLLRAALERPRVSVCGPAHVDYRNAVRGAFRARGFAVAMDVPGTEPQVHDCDVAIVVGADAPGPDSGRLGVRLDVTTSSVGAGWSVSAVGRESRCGTTDEVVDIVVGLLVGRRSDCDGHTFGPDARSWPLGRAADRD